MKRTAVITLALSALLLSSCAQSSPALTGATWIEGACTQKQPGVTLSVDYLGKVTTRCALNYSGNGWDLIRAAGFDVQGTAKYPTSFACKINGQPTKFNCDETDPQTSYWGYFVSANANWEYATTGASDRKSVCGSWEGWVFMESESTGSHLPKPQEFECG